MDWTIDIRKYIQECNSVEKLGIIIALEQSDYHYDPCGKSSWGIDDNLTDISKQAIKKIILLKNLNGAR